MARGGKRGEQHEPGHEHAKPDDDDGRHVTPEGRDHRVHVNVLEHRLRGSVVPTAELYAKALAQWHRLPGAIATSAIDLGAVDDAGKR
jgi:hypothetical protein